MAIEKPVTFLNRNGHRLFGMLYMPDRQISRRVGIIISVNAIKYRLGTFRLHVLLARRLCELGYSVFSFDPEGIGDSEGEFEYKSLTQHYYDIQTGKYHDDLADAIGYFASQRTVDSLILFGLCGGAISVLLEAASDPRISGLILLNVPVLVEELKHQQEADNAAKITSSESAMVLLKSKMHRFVEADFWRRLTRLQVDVREEARLVQKATVVLAQKIWTKGREILFGSQAPAELTRPVSKNRLFNMHFQQAFLQAMEGRKQILFVFAELDAWTWIFKSEFQDLVLRPGNPFEDRCTIELLRSANHIFSGRESQRQLEQCIVAWLGRYHPVTEQSEQAVAL